jgi:hypothetical protein
MAITKIRQYGTRTVPLLKDRVSYGDIVNDTTLGGTAVPASAESVKGLQTSLNVEIADRVQQGLDLVDGASTNGNTLGKIETLVGTSSEANTEALAQEVADRNAAIQFETDRSVAAEAVIQTNIDKEISDRTSADEALNTALTAAIDAETARATAAETVNADKLITLNGGTDVVGSIDSKILVETNRASAEEQRIEAELIEEIAIRTEGTATKAYTDDAVAVEKARAEATEATNTTAINNETTTRVAEISRVDVRVDDLGILVANNKTANDSAIATEASTRSTADTALSDRLNAVESSIVGGVAWKGSVDVVSNPEDGQTSIDGLVEDDLIAGQAYYVTAAKDVYVVLDGTSGDYKPEAFESKSFLKIADFKELSGLVTAEQGRAQAAEAALQAAIDAEIANRISEISRVEGLVTSETNRALAAEQVNADAIAQTIIDYATADDAVRAEFAAADSAIQNTMETELASVYSRMDSASESFNTALQVETDRAIAAETANKTSIDILNGDDTVAGSVASGIKVETDRALAAELVNANAIVQEVSDRIADVDAEEARALAAEAVIADNLTQEVIDRTADVDAEEARAKAAEDAINSTLDVINADKTVVGSIANAQYEAQVYADHWIPMMKLEGMDGSLTVSGDDVTVTYVPMTDGIIYGEVIVYDPSNGDAIAVNVKSVASNVITLDTVTAGEFDGFACKVQYMFKEGDQDGAGMGVAGEGGAGV